MPHLTPPAFQRSVYGVVAYWALNLVLVGAEARWHILTRLTLYDISQLKTLGSLLVKLAHPS